MRLLEHTFLGLGYRRVLFRESNVCAPIYKRFGITKRTGWHTFRRTYTTPLYANGEDVKVVQELLRHGSSRITMDVYAQAVTPAKRNAQGKVVAMLGVMKKEEKLG
jgi:integrase